MDNVADRVLETTTSTGDDSATMNLAGSETGWRGFVEGLSEDTDEASGPWTEVPYLQYTLSGGDVDEWEIGTCTITDASPDTLTAKDVLYSSDGEGAGITWSAGTKYIKLSPLVETMWWHSNG